MNHSIAIAVCGFLCLLTTGCVGMNNTQAGAVTGTGLGAVTGAIVGDVAGGRPGAGALIGAATGAVAGGLLGNAEDAREERDAAIAQAQYNDAQARAVAQAVTEDDVITMTRNGVGDNVIVNAVRTRGCRWDGTPDAIIRLKQQGVGDEVIKAMQSGGVRAPVLVETVPPPAHIYYGPPPPPVGGAVIFVRPGYYGPRPWGPPHRHHHW